MTIIVDDEKIGASSTEEALKKVVPQAETAVFNSPKKALEYAETNHIDCAFLDISMQGMNGIELAKKIKMIHSKCNIVFTTGYDNYYGDAFQIGASDYLLKPITEEKIKHALEYMRTPISRGKKGLVCQCFGNFEVYYDEKPLRFGRSKSKELLAYLIYRNGAGVTKNEIMANLWEEDNSSYYGVVKKDLIDVLHSVGADDVLHVQWKTLGINKEKISCDFFDFQNGVPDAINKFYGEFMSQYSWAMDIEAVLCGK